MTTKITTDWHLAVRRAGGTTPESQLALRNYLRSELDDKLDDCDHLIAGDLFNDFTVDISELIAAYDIFSSWLRKYGKQLALLRGNHDFSVRGNQVSSFDLLAYMLRAHFPEQVTVATEVTEWKQFILVPHLPNNGILNVEVGKLSGVKDKVVVFHANIDNFHAAETRNSLNLMIEQVEDLVSRGNLVVCGHEHQYRPLVKGRCVVLGNTAPSSVADCLGNSKKYAAYITGTDIELVETWRSEGNYCEINWRELDAGAILKHQFFRVTGEASAAQAADVVGAIAKFRQQACADVFVVSNAVKVEGQELVSELALDSMEAIKQFDVLGCILEKLEPKEAETVKELLG